jgi:bile acid:Na+ symporter, BASS family
MGLALARKACLPRGRCDGVFSRAMTSLLGRRFWLLAYGAILAGALLPRPQLDVRALIPLFLGGLVFFTSLKVGLRSVLALFVERGDLSQLLRFSLVKLVAVPVVAGLLCQLLRPEWSLGVVLIAAMPAGLSSAAFADVYKGHTTLALAVVVATSLLCPITIPLMLHGFAYLQGGEVGLTAWAVAHQAGFVCVLLFGPASVAQAIRRKAPLWLIRNQHRWTPWALVCLAVVIFLSAWATDVFSSLSYRTAARSFEALVVVSALVVVFLGAGYAMSRRLPRGDGVAFSCSLVYVNNGLALAFGSIFFANRPEVLLPTVLVTIPMVWGVALVPSLVPSVQAER